MQGWDWFMSLPVSFLISYSWLLKLFGIEGDVQLGLKEISRVAGYSGKNESIRIFRLEALFYSPLSMPT